MTLDTTARQQRIDLNADMGESDETEALARDIALLDQVSSCNIACGGHAGSDDVMRTLIDAAQQRNVAIGAHPSYPDKANFGRISLAISPESLAISLRQQISLLKSLCLTSKAALTHVKPHGALYNDAAKDPALAQLVADIVKDQAPDAALVGLAHSHMEQAARRAGISFIAEAFADRRYDHDRSLVPREQPGAIIADEKECATQALAIASGRAICDGDGKTIDILADSICIHSDSPMAVQSAVSTRRFLEAAGITIAHPIHP